MARLKFALFFLPALIVWPLLLATSAARFGDAIVRNGATAAHAARLAAESAVSSRRAELASALAGAMSAVPAASAKATRADGLRQLLPAVRLAVNGALPEATRANVVLVAALGADTLVVRGADDPKAPPDDLDLAGVTQSGPVGATLPVFGTLHQFYSSTLPTPLGPLAVALGAPVVTVDAIESIAQRTGLAAVGLAEAGKLLASAGAEKDALTQLLRPGAPAVAVVRGPSASFGPFALPMAGGGGAPRAVAVREAVGGTTLEVVALASVTVDALELAALQRLVLSISGLLLLLGALGVALAGASRPQPAASTSNVVSAERRRTGARPAAEPVQPIASAGQHAQDTQPPLGDLPPVPEATPDDFPFGNGPSIDSIRQEPTNILAAPVPSAAEVFGALEPALLPTESPTAVNQTPPGALPTQVGSLPEAMVGYPPSYSYEDDDGESTRVAEVPSELLQQSALPEALPAYAEPSYGAAVEAPPSIAAAAPLAPVGDDAHFQAVYREFVATRERCGEAAEGLTYDKFVGKLVKNREQLIQKYACRTVRFQVYVKEGKAALKATPVRD